MPFKTKRRKLSAAEKHIKFTEEGLISYTSNKEGIYKDEADNKSATASVRHRISGLVTEVDGVGVRRELTKIVLLAALIIGLQIALKISNLPLFR